MASPRVPFANFCPVCGVNSKQLRPETTLGPMEYSPWTCTACGHQWVMVAAGASLHGHWKQGTAYLRERLAANPPPSSSWVTRPAMNGGPHVVGRIIRGKR